MNFGPLVSALLIVVTFSVSAQAQRSAFLSGRVLDPSGAAVPEAFITAVNQESGFRRTTASDSEGAYIIASLDPGLYKVTVRKEGFIGMIRFDVHVALLEPARVDFNLIVGAVQETITVEGTAPLMAHEDGAIGARIFHDDVQRVPLGGRGLLALVEFSPGTNVTPATRGDSCR